MERLWLGSRLHLIGENSSTDDRQSRAGPQKAEAFP
jgi:hypothetical protein